VTALGGCCSISTRRPIESNSRQLAAAMGDDGDDEAGGMRLVVTIPDGVEAGQALLVEVPSGREMSVRDCHCLSPRRSHRASAAAAHHS
jgi:hypothetical protein